MPNKPKAGGSFKGGKALYDLMSPQMQSPLPSAANGFLNGSAASEMSGNQTTRANLDTRRKSKFLDNIQPLEYSVAGSELAAAGVNNLRSLSQVSGAMPSVTDAGESPLLQKAKNPHLKVSQADGKAAA